MADKIHERIHQRRKELGLSVVDVANALGVSRATVYRYESSEIEKLPTDILGPLSKVLRCSPAYLAGWEEHAWPTDAEKRLLSYFSELNAIGKEEAINRLGEMLESKKYQKGDGQ